MKTPRLFFTALLFPMCLQQILAQVTENFSDGNFSDNPAWISSNPNDWTINASLQLQSNRTVASSSFWISTANVLATGVQWDFWMRLSFNTSSANMVDVYLIASAPDISLNSTTGYFVRMGNTDDEIALYRKDNGVAPVKIIDGINGVLNSSNNLLRVRVIRDAAGEWTLLRALGGNESDFFEEGKAADNRYLETAFFGILVRQSTASFFQRHFFDDISIKAYEPDRIPPEMVSATAKSSKQIDLLFNEPVSVASAEKLSHYHVNNIGNPSTAKRNVNNPALVTLNFSQAFENGIFYELTLAGVEDLSGNKLQQTKTRFSFFQPGRNDAIISEIMSDPSPQVGLPNIEWIELRNTTAHAFNIQGWKIGREATGLSAAMPDFLLQPDSAIILCGSSGAALMRNFGTTIALNAFPTLPVSGSVIWVEDAFGKNIHTATYQSSWHENALKANGGWSLEMIDIQNPCGGKSNWRSSTDPKGGTPGKSNSVQSSNPDNTPPLMVHAFAPDSLQITLTFNETLDSSQAVITSNYRIDHPTASIQNAICTPPLFQQTILQLSAPLQKEKIYTIAAQHIRDCKSNTTDSEQLVKLALHQQPAAQDIVINEILFDPRGSGADFIELYNRSKKTFNLKELMLANRSNGNIANYKNLRSENQLFFPGNLLVFTDNAMNIRNEYVVKKTEWLFEMSSLPSYPNDAGQVVLTDAQGNIIDELQYSDKWHFKLIENKEGISLERINPHTTSQQADNWTSAAKSAGYATPTAINSQYRQDTQVQGTIAISPEIFSPDQDGFDDFVTIDYRFPEPRYVLNITIFDASGRAVKALQRNAICGITGSFRWDGLDEKNMRLPLGPYVVFCEAFNLSGQVKRFKHQVVLARRW